MDRIDCEGRFCLTTIQERTAREEKAQYRFFNLTVWPPSEPS
jgi:hypothetical protein